VKGQKMEKQTCNYAFGVSSDEMNNELCEKNLHRLFQTKERLDRPLINLTEEEVYKIAEQLRTLIKAMRSLPVETLNRYIRSSDSVFQKLQDIVVKLYLALDQLSSGDKSVFYRHLLSSQQDIADIFTFSLLEIPDVANQIVPLALTSGLSRKPTTNYKAMLDFARNVLPVLSALFQNKDAIYSDQCKQAIVDMKKLEIFVEKQKAVLETSSIAFDECNELAKLHCKLEIALPHVGDLVQKLIHLLSAFQLCCHSRSKRAMRCREEIVYYLTLFNYDYDNMLKTIHEMNILQDQARFLYKPLEQSSMDILSVQG
jgi:hypothetical protein